MNEEKIEIKSGKTQEEQEIKAAPVEVEKEDLSKFPWSDEENVDYKYADMHVWCRQCGTDNGPEQPDHANIQTGLVIQSKADNTSHIALACGNCGAQLVFHFREAANPPTPEEEMEMERKRLEEREKALAAQANSERESNIEVKEEK